MSDIYLVVQTSITGLEITPVDKETWDWIHDPRGLRPLKKFAYCDRWADPFVPESVNRKYQDEFPNTKCTEIFVDLGSVAVCRAQSAMPADGYRMCFSISQLLVQLNDNSGVIAGEEFFEKITDRF